jgi:hypothetical protein
LSKIYQISLLVADGLGDETINNIQILDIGKPPNRFFKFFVTPFKLYIASIKVNADVCHLHDPEILLISLLLKRRKIKVFFDSHEDYQVQILIRPYLNKYFLKIFSHFLFIYLVFFLPKVDGIVCATDEIKKKLIRFNKNIIVIKNYPITEK